MPTRKVQERVLHIDRFLGIINKADPLRVQKEGNNQLAQAGFSSAINVEVDDEGKLRGAPGYTSVASPNISAAFTTEDEELFYYVSGADLCVLGGDFSETTLYSFVYTPEEINFLEINKSVYVSTGREFLVLEGSYPRRWGDPVPAVPTVTPLLNGVLDEGQYQVAQTFFDPLTRRESGACEPVIVDLPSGGSLRITAQTPPSGMHTATYVTTANGTILYWAIGSMAGDTFIWGGPSSQLAKPLTTQNLVPPPEGSTHLAAYEGRIWLGRYIPEHAYSIITPSNALSYEHFDTMKSLLIPGKLTLLEGTEKGLLVGTEDQVLGYNGSDLEVLAEYGATSGRTGAMHEKQVYFWTERGACRAFPFENMTAENVSVQEGKNGTGVILKRGGFARYITVLEQGGLAHNPFEGT